MSIHEYLLARELGNPLARGLELYKTTHLWHSLEPASPGSFPTTTHRMGVTALDIDRQQGRYLLSANADGGVAVWDLESEWTTTTPTAVVPGGGAAHCYSVSSITYYPSDAGLFVTGSYDRSVKVWDASAGPVVAFTFAPMEAAVHCVAMAPRGLHTLVAVASDSPAVRLLDLDTGGATHSLLGHTAGTLAVGWSPRDEFLLASAGRDGTARLWDVRMAASCLAYLDMDNSGRSRLDGRNCAHEGTVNGLAWREDGASLLTLGHDDKLRVWDLATGQNTLTNFEPVIRNRRQQTSNPVLTCLRHSDPQIVFIPSGAEIIGFHIIVGDVVLKERVTKHSVTALVYRPHLTELYYGSTGGEINMLAPCPVEAEDDDDESKAGTDTDVLNDIYQSLVRAPITVT